MSWLLWEKLLHEGNKRFQGKTKVFNTKLKFRDPKETFSVKVCKKKTKNSKQTWPQRVWKPWKQTFFHVVLFVCFPANFCFKLVGPEFVFRVETNLFRKRFFPSKNKPF